jgi:hypothetical protein
MAAETRVWLVERSYGSDENLVTLVYATTDGERHLKKQLSHSMLRRKTITAARTVEDDRLEVVLDDELRERYATEATRMADSNDPDEPV